MIADREYIARELGFKSAKALDERLNFFIKVGTDGFKTLIDQAPIQTPHGRPADQMPDHVWVSAPWTNWPNEAAFHTFIPQRVRQRDE